MKSFGLCQFVQTAQADMNIYLTQNHYDPFSQRMTLIFFFLQVFDELRKINPTFSQKLIPFDGDLSRENMGLCNEVYTQMKNEVSVIFHSAALIKFNPPFRYETLSHNNPCFRCNIAISNFLVTHTCEIRFHDDINRSVRMFT